MNSVQRRERLAVGGDDDVGDSPLITKSGSKTTVPIVRALGQRFERVGVGFVGGQQRELGQRRAEQRRRHQAPCRAPRARRPRRRVHHPRRRVPRAPPARPLRPARTTASTKTRRSLARIRSPCAPPQARRACRPAPRRFRAAARVLQLTAGRIAAPPKPPSPLGATSGRPMPIATPAPAAAAATGRVPA